MENYSNLMNFFFKSCLICTESDELDLSGPFYLGGLDYLDPGLTYPPAIWSASLKKGGNNASLYMQSTGTACSDVPVSHRDSQ